MRLSILCIHGVPSRQGVHWPQDSCAKNFAMFVTAFGMSVVSSITMIAAEPSIDFAAATPSKSMGRFSISFAVRIAADAPPGMTALSFRPPFTPPAIARRVSQGTPRGAS